MLTQRTESADRLSLLRSLPVFPAVALELIDTVEEGAVDAAGIVHLLERDPGLSAEILQRANSARFARRREVTELTDAVMLLGTDQTARVAMSAACRGLMAPALGRPELRCCWEHSVASAILADAMAPFLKQAPRSAYTAGLLHDIGCLAMLAVYPDRYLETLTLVRSEGVAWLEAERRVFGADHCSVGRWVADEWGLPDSLRKIIIHHHDERPLDDSLLSVVSIATTLAGLISPRSLLRPPWPSPEKYVSTLRLETASLMMAVDTATARIRRELAS